MADDELFENLDDFGDLDEEPSFGLVEDEFPLDLMEPEPEGLSRTFKIVGALMALDAEADLQALRHGAGVAAADRRLLGQAHRRR